MKNKVTKAIFPVAGLGTRFLPVDQRDNRGLLSYVELKSFDRGGGIK